MAPMKLKRVALAGVGALALVAALQTPAMATGGAQSRCQNDPSASVKLCVTINYDEITCSGVPCFKVTSLNYSATRLNSGIQLVRVAVAEGAFSKSYNPATKTYGAFLQSSGTTVGSVSYPTSGTSYKATALWPTKYGQVFAQSNEYHGGWTGVTWKRSGSSTTYNWHQATLNIQ